MSEQNVITLYDYTDITEEGAASAAITPGDLVEFGGANLFRRHASAGGNQSRLFAEANLTQGKSINDDWALGERVVVKVFNPGERVNARLASGQNVARGAYLESAGDGTLQEHVVDSTGVYNHLAIVGRAYEAVDATAGVSRIAVTIL